jgi:hypothetical protein
VSCSDREGRGSWQSELSFGSHEDLVAGLDPAEGRAAAADLGNLANCGATVFVQHD